jgi:hypothetical protein
MSFLEETAVGERRARNIKMDASHPMYKLNRQEYANAGICRFSGLSAEGLLSCHSSYASR